VIVPCDGCHKAFSHLLKTINAKDWKPNICNISVEESLNCSNDSCKFSIAGECCVEFQFCDDCLNNKSIVSKLFIEYGT